MSAQRNREGPQALHRDDPGLEGENHALGARRSTEQFAKAMKREGYAVVAPDQASARAREHLLAVLAERRPR